MIYIQRVINLRKAAVIAGVVLILILIPTQTASADTSKEGAYLIKVNRVFNTITVYEKDDKGEYTVPIKAMLCSVGGKGTETTKGTFRTLEKYRWKLLMGDVWGQYSTRIVKGILFHSVYYYGTMNPASLATKEFNKLGTAASHGCIRLNVEDAKWIYDHCSIGTTVTIYDDKKSPGPLGKPKAIRIPSDVRWDPTDPNSKNPFNEKMPSFTGIKNIVIPWGDKVDLLNGIKAKSSINTDITSKINVNGTIDSYQAGEYLVTYSVTDPLGKTASKQVKVTVKESKKKPEFVGIEDIVAGEGAIIDHNFALSRVEAYCAGVKLDKKKITVTIENDSEEEYILTYKVSVGKKVSTTATAYVYIDKEAPVFTGITDHQLQPEEIPDEDMVLTDVDVSDNYTQLEKSDIQVTIEQDEDGNYLVTYEAIDEAGNDVLCTAQYYY